MNLIEKEVYLVTGGSRGVGRAVASALAASGAVVGVGHCQSREAAAELAATSPDRLIPVGFDVADPKATHEAVATFASSQGSLSGIVCCAGVGVQALLLRQRPEAVARYVAVNLLGTIYTVQAALPYLTKVRSPVVLTISSVAAVQPVSGQTVYAATKGGIESFTRALAVEYADRGLRAVCLRLGLVDTDMLRAVNPDRVASLRTRSLAGRDATPDEVAAFALSLLNQQFLNASVVALDGGYGAK